MTNPNDPASPVLGQKIPYFGLTKRETFAAMAMQGLAANPAFEDIPAVDICRSARAHADFLIAELNKAQE